MSENTVFVKKHIVVLLAAALFVHLFGCSPKVLVHKEIRGSIEQNPSWKMSEKCGDDDCTVMVDFLTGKDMSLKIEFDNDQQTKHFFIIRKIGRAHV
jgi:hypothetical protein